MPSVQNLKLRFHLRAMMPQLPVNGMEHLVRLRKVLARIHFGAADTGLGRMVPGAETILRNAISVHPRQPSITVDVKNDGPPYYGFCELLDDEDVNHKGNTSQLLLTLILLSLSSLQNQSGLNIYVYFVRA